MRESILRRYDTLAQAGTLEPDPVQRALAERLDRLVETLAERRLGSKKKAFGWLFSRAQAQQPAGLYIWGSVGRGKTLLMDLFFAAAPHERKRRVHFHEFMDEVHRRLEAFRRKLRSGEAKGDDPIPPVAAEIAAETRLLCLDEFAVNDIADAMILSRLFESLFRRGVALVATSNTPPYALYKDGLNRALFLPAIALIERNMEVFHLEAPKDYRRDKAGTAAVYLTPAGLAADQKLDRIFRDLTGRERGEPTKLDAGRRKIPVPQAADGVARFTFGELCAVPLGAADYLKIARAFDTIVVSDIPVMTPATRNEAKRFINLIDTLYDNGVCLVASAEAPPDMLWRGQTGVEAQEFKRTASRLVEMQSDAYLNRSVAARRRACV